MSYPAISLTTPTVGRHRRPQKRLQTVATPHLPEFVRTIRVCYFLSPFQCPLPVHPCPSVDSGLPLVMGSIFSAFSMGVLLEACGGWISPQAGLTDKSVNSVWGSERVASCDGAFIRAGWSVFSGIGLWVGLR